MARYYNFFSQEIVIKILSWLPVKSLLRFRSVCKLWRFIISDPEFIEIHLTNSKKRPSILAGATIFDQEIDSWYSAFSLIYSHSIEDSANLLVPSPLARVVLDINTSTSCNGLVCLTDFDVRYIYLWNPLTRQCMILPSPNIQPHVHPGVYIGFYFDSVVDDYKILRIVYQQHVPFDEVSARVELYSTKSDSWREIQFNHANTKFLYYPHGPSSIIKCGPVINRVLYMNRGDQLILFQLHNEIFKPLPLPSIKPRTIKSKSKIFDFQGCVALLLHCNNDESLSLWTLDDDDGSGIVSWTKNFNLETSFGIDRTSVYLGDGQFAAYEESERIILYDYKTKEIIKKLQFETDCSLELFQGYTESLVSVKRFIKF